MKAQYWVLTEPDHKLHNPIDVTKALRDMYNDNIIENYEYLNQYKNGPYGLEELVEIELNDIIDFMDILEFFMFKD